MPNSINTQKLVTYCNQFLAVDNFKDYCPNGLQVQGQATIKKIITGVTACQALIDEAVKKQADAIFVHHGFFWKGENQVITGMKYRRIKALLAHNINLIAYHLPLDAHEQVGNNALFAKALNLSNRSCFGQQNLALMGSVDSLSGTQLAQKLSQILGREPLHIDAVKPIKKLALCTGAAQGFIVDAIAEGADAFISGEISENTVHIAREHGIHYFAAGHHATERFGTKALGHHLADKFGLDVEFVDIHNPV